MIRLNLAQSDQLRSALEQLDQLGDFFKGAMDNNDFYWHIELHLNALQKIVCDELKLREEQLHAWREMMTQ